MHDYISSAPTLDDGQLAFILPALLTPLQAAKKDTNVVLGGYFLLSVLSQKIQLKSIAITTIIGAMIAPVKGKENYGASTSQFIKAAIAVCSPQEVVPELSAAITKKYLKMPNFVDETCSVLRVIGVEKFLLPIMQSLQNQLDELPVSSLFSAVINCPDASLAITECIVSMLIRTATSMSSLSGGSHSGVDPAAARSLLGLIHQRSFELLRHVADQVFAETVPTREINNSDERKERRKRTDELLASFSLAYPLALSADVNEVVVTSADPSKESRTDAVRKLYSMLRSAEGAISSQDMASIRSALFGRVYDPHQSVLEALYHSPDIFLQVVTPTTPPQKLLDAIVSQLQPTPPARAVLQAHAAFLAGPFSASYPELHTVVQQDALFPFLLASKAKFKSSRGVWEAVKESGGFQTGWVKGCVEVWDQANLLDKARSDDQNEDSENVEKISEANIGVVSQIVANILASDDQAHDIERLLSKLQDSMSHARVLAYLVCRGLLIRSSVDEQISLAARILDVMGLRALDGADDDLNESALEEVLSEQQLIARVTARMTGRSTIYALQASILVLISGLAAPRASCRSRMISDPVTNPSEGVDQQYVALMRSLYVLAASSAMAAPTCLSMFLLRTLFLNLKDSSLTFLLGILLSTVPATSRVRTHALLHTLAFLRGHAESGTVDFQIVLPSLIAVLMDERTDKRDRALVLENIAMLSTATKKNHVYGLDTMYGDASSDLQYLEPKDLTAYVKAMVESREPLVQDAGYIKMFHQRHLGGSNTKYKRRVLCFLLSHAITHPCPFARVALLHTVENLTDSTKSHMLLPAVKSLMKDPTAAGRMFGSLLDEYTSLVVAGFLTIASGSLNGTAEDDIWSLFVALLRHYFLSNANVTARTLITAALEERLFVDLDLDKRVEVCIVLLRVGGEGGEAFLASKALLTKLLRDAALIIHLLVELQPSRLSTESPASKRPKLEKTPESLASDQLQALTILAEVLGTSDTPGSVDLISRLLETLDKVIHAKGLDTSDTNYVCQMLMAAIERSASKMTEPFPHPIRLEVLLELIRVTENPQTFNEALLLMASLARFAPESVLHNVMPIFTFMGSNVFHRDDSYSFKVVQNTINSIVPVMVSSLQAKYSKGLELYIGAREFLRIFTDAAHHVPRHRRENFFGHLGEILGPQDFLPPLCMLLIDKATNRARKQTIEEARTTLSLPTALLQRFPRSLRIYVLCEVLRECSRLVSRLSTPEGDQTIFLDYSRGDEEYSTSSPRVRRCVHVLLLFSSIVPVAPDDHGQEVPLLDGSRVNDMVSLLVHLATLTSDQEKDHNLSSIATAAQMALARVTNAISAVEFLSATVLMLQSTEERVKIGALEVLAERIPLVSETVRRECKPTAIQIVQLTHDIIARRSAGKLAEAGLAGFKAIASTCQVGEEAALTSTIPDVLKIVKSRTSAASALAVLPCYISALGPRIIPFFKEIVQECTLILSEDLKDRTPLSIAGGMALETLQSLSTSLPSFYGAAELTRIVDLHIEYSAALAPSSDSNLLASLIKSIAKRASSDILLPVLYQLWPSLGKRQTKEDVNKFDGYFAILKLSLKAAPRSSILEHLRHIFKVFTEAFDLGMMVDSEEEETPVLSAFIEVVAKLNESAFRPLFRKLHDWAFVDQSSSAERKTTFCRIYVALLDYFKGLINPYMAMLIRPLSEILDTFPPSCSPSDAALWSGVMVTLNKSLENDDGAFWREDKLSAILPSLLSQLPITIRLPSPQSTTVSTLQPPKQLIIRTLLSLATLLPASSSDQLKRLNLDLLMHSRSEDPRVRALALECSREIWKAEGGKFIGFGAETATFIAECAEDENDNVVREAHKLRAAVETVAGSIRGL